MANEFVVKNGVIIKTGSLTVGDPTTTGYSLPSADGSAGQALVTDGAGSVTFSTVSGAAATSMERVRVNYIAGGGNVNLDSIASTTSGVSAVIVDADGNTALVDFTFTGFDFPPASVMTYGYVAGTNQYIIRHPDTTFTTRRLEGGGSSPNPVAFGDLGSNSIRMSITANETGAAGSFGVAAHVFVVFLMVE